MRLAVLAVAAVVAVVGGDGGVGSEAVPRAVEEPYDGVFSIGVFCNTAPNIKPEGGMASPCVALALMLQGSTTFKFSLVLLKATMSQVVLENHAIPVLDLANLLSGQQRIHALIEVGIDALGLENATTTPDIVLQADKLVGHEVRRLQSHGTRVIDYRNTNDYNLFAESVVYNLSAATFDLDQSRDAVFATTDQALGFVEILSGAPVVVVPPPLHLLTPTTPERERWAYAPNTEGKRRIAIMEDNKSLFRNSLFPFYVLEAVHRQYPAAIDQAYITNTEAVAQNKHYRQLVTWKGTSYKAGRVSFEKRFDPTWFLTKLTDVLLCWQWDDTSPGLEFEALARGFPLVHNNPRFQDCGYYYEGFEVEDAAKQLHRALAAHDNPATRPAYEAQAHRCAAQHSIASTAVQMAWHQALLRVVRPEPN